ncbi:hypothetical protein ACFO0N_15255 [Halobium salinum]|uniref:Uncharacterized protein n=2 Tax=Halobium salinum TaxID=1364940 RepID=A0ABD5PEP4_9EURY
MVVLLRGEWDEPSDELSALAEKYGFEFYPRPGDNPPGFYSTVSDTTNFKYRVP